MVLRVRERTNGGVPQLVITKKPVRSVVWHWNDRRIRVPFMNSANFIELGPAQHGIMLKQLRYVKSTMHDLPWAKAHLRALLSKYTAKDVTKEQLYPQLNALGHQQFKATRPDACAPESNNATELTTNSSTAPKRSRQVTTPRNAML
ncbi:hypothetical protein BBJ29_005813 [Phytophthora kernoviae]|uniref:Uncharacterized protein n=1 Tax=Phytophthora kernoviae TaxID=325452 RepID=A0A3R7GAT1_9STRA|nr:hypothetical protein BBJ29_005813 [Phytophthora kernoviae]